MKRMHPTPTDSLPKVLHCCLLLSAVTLTSSPLPHVGASGSAAVRLQEAKQRARLLKELDEASKRVSQLITELQREYGDVLLYKVSSAAMCCLGLSLHDNTPWLTVNL